MHRPARALAPCLAAVVVMAAATASRAAVLPTTSWTPTTLTAAATRGQANSVPFTFVTPVTGLSNVQIVVRTKKDAVQADPFTDPSRIASGLLGATAAHPGTYSGRIHVGCHEIDCYLPKRPWAMRPATYYWQISAVCTTGCSAVTYTPTANGRTANATAFVSSVHRLTITARR